MNAFHFAVAVLPLAAYFAVLALPHLFGKPWVVDGGRDRFALGAAAMGLALIGPLELFLPEPAAAVFGVYTRGMMAMLYLLFVTLTILYARPSMTIYNVDAAALRERIASVLTSLSADLTWVGDGFHSPTDQIQGRLDVFPYLRAARLYATSDNSNPRFWKRLRKELANAMRAEKASRGLLGGAFLLFAISLAIAAACMLANAPSDAKIAMARYFMQAD